MSASKTEVTEVTILHNIITDVKAYYFCHIPWVRNKSQVPHPLKGRGLQVMNTRRQRKLGVILKPLDNC